MFQGVSLRTVVALTVTIIAALCGSVTSAGVLMDYAAIPAEEAQIRVLGGGHFDCENKPLDLSKGLYCYGPAAIRAAYGVDALIAAGADGHGQTIVIVDAFGSPFVDADLQIYNTTFGLPAANFQQIYMPDTPAYSASNGTMVGWTAEIALDVEWAHAMAPAASIVLVAAKSNDETDLIAALNYALDHLSPNAISLSFGAAEVAFLSPAGLESIKDWNAAFAKARRQRVTLFAAAMDRGVDTAGIGVPNVGWPAGAALVTSVGGTNLFFATNGLADPNGSYVSEQVWNDGFGAGGGGVSRLTPEPNFQKSLPRTIQQQLKGFRGVPDVGMNAGVVGGLIVAWSAYRSGTFYVFGGTSAGAPEWAGIVADIDALLARPIGFLNTKLYALGGRGQLSSLLHDVTLGDNSYRQVPGYPAMAGFDLATGWGTPNVGSLLSLLRATPDDEDADF